MRGISFLGVRFAQLILITLRAFSECEKRDLCAKKRPFFFPRNTPGERTPSSSSHGLTSKMSHDGSWHAACRIRLSNLWLRFGHRNVARSVTDPGVGSGVLFGVAAA
jgi:hypothetical protein